MLIVLWRGGAPETETCTHQKEHAEPVIPPQGCISQLSAPKAKHDGEDVDDTEDCLSPDDFGTVVLVQSRHDDSRQGGHNNVKNKKMGTCTMGEVRREKRRSEVLTEPPTSGMVLGG